MRRDRYQIYRPFSRRRAVVTFWRNNHEKGNAIHHHRHPGPRPRPGRVQAQCRGPL